MRLILLTVLKDSNGLGNNHHAVSASAAWDLINVMNVDGIDYKFIEGFNEHYAVDKDGNVYSLYVNVRTREASIPHYRVRKLVPSVAPNGYLRVRLAKDFNRTHKLARVHRLVAEAFIPNPENKPFINHKDGNKQNNHADNLEWVTQKENIHHAIKMGMYKIIKPEKRTAQYTLYGKLVRVFESATEAARANNYAQSSVSEAAKMGRKYRDYIFEYV